MGNRRRCRLRTPPGGPAGQAPACSPTLRTSPGVDRVAAGTGSAPPGGAEMPFPSRQEEYLGIFIWRGPQEVRGFSRRKRIRLQTSGARGGARAPWAHADVPPPRRAGSKPDAFPSACRDRSPTTADDTAAAERGSPPHPVLPEPGPGAAAAGGAVGAPPSTPRPRRR